MQIVPVSEGRTIFYLVLAEFKFCFMGQWEDKLCKHLLRAGKTGFFDSELPCKYLYKGNKNSKSRNSSLHLQWNTPRREFKIIINHHLLDQFAITY